MWAKAAKMLFEAWYEIYVKHPELAMVEMRVL